MDNTLLLAVMIEHAKYGTLLQGILSILFLDIGKLFFA